MTIISHDPGAATEPRWKPAVRVREMWASLAIIVMWLSVLFDAVWGPDLVSTTTTTTSQVPSAILIAPFAFFGTWVIAKYGFGTGRRDDPR